MLRNIMAADQIFKSAHWKAHFSNNGKSCSDEDEKIVKDIHNIINDERCGEDYIVSLFKEEKIKDVKLVYADSKSGRMVCDLEVEKFLFNTLNHGLKRCSF